MSIRSAKMLLLKVFGSGDAPRASRNAAAPAERVLEIQAEIGRGELERAEGSIRELLHVHTNDPALQMLLGQLALAKKDDGAAAGHFENAVALEPDLAAAHVALANIYTSRKEPEHAQPHYEAAVRLFPDIAELRNNLGWTYLTQERLDEAEGAFEEALRLKPDFAEARNNLGRVHSERKHFERAIQCFQAALALDSTCIDALFNEGVALRQLGENEQALERLQTCRQAAPRHVPTLCALAHTLFELNRVGEAQAQFRAALAIDPGCADAHFGLAVIDLVEGQFERGWRQYEWRTRLPKFERYYNRPQPRWQGENVHGKTLIVNAEQGYGDVLMFARFLPRIGPEFGARVIFRCRAPLIRLMRASIDVERVLDIETDETTPGDVSMPMLSIANHLHIGWGDLPGSIPYLAAPAELIDQWRARIARDTQLRVGLAWRGNPLRAHERRRVPRPEDYRPLAAVNGVTFYNIEPGCSADELANFPVRLVDLTPEIEDFADSAALVSNLDLVISVDTSAAHLAGAVGKPTWLLHPDVPDWRWEIDGRESPWYPTVRLFRRGAGWSHTLTAVRDALRIAVASNVTQNVTL